MSATASTSALPLDLRNVTVVEDLQLSPAHCIGPQTPIEQALQEGLMRDFSILPIVDKGKKAVGYLSLPSLQQEMQRGTLAPNDPVEKGMRKFQLSKPFQIITPDTDLRTLELFFKDNDFAIITDQERKFVLAVCTADDLNKFLERAMPRSPLLRGQ